MDKARYEKPVLNVHGSVASLTNGKPGSDLDGVSGLRSPISSMGGGGSMGGGMGMGMSWMGR